MNLTEINAEDAYDISIWLEVLGLDKWEYKAVVNNLGYFEAAIAHYKLTLAVKGLSNSEIEESIQPFIDAQQAHLDECSALGDAGWELVSIQSHSMETVPYEKALGIDNDKITSQVLIFKRPK